jgi:arginase family enzyme
MSEASLFQGGYNFLGLPTTLSAREHAKARVLPVPYDATTSYAAGTRNPATVVRRMILDRKTRWMK